MFSPQPSSLPEICCEDALALRVQKLCLVGAARIAAVRVNISSTVPTDEPWSEKSMQGLFPRVDSNKRSLQVSPGNSIDTTVVVLFAKWKIGIQKTSMIK